MARKGRNRRGGRVTPKGTRPAASRSGRQDDVGWAEPALDFMGDVRQALADDHPLGLLALASSLLAVVEPRLASPLGPGRGEPAGPSREEVLRSLMEVELPETSALLAAIAWLSSVEVEQRRIARVLDRRDHVLPAWLASTGAVAYRTVEVAHVLGDGDNLMVGVRLPTGHELSAVVYIDHNLGTVVKDAMVVGEPIAELIALMRTSSDDPDTTFCDIPGADARVRVEEAVETGSIMFPPLETDTWPACRPLVEWVVRLLPEGGDGYVRPEWSDDDRRDLADRFIASPFAVSPTDDDQRDLLDAFLWFGCDYGPGDPMRWSPVAVEIILLDWMPRKIVADVDYLAKAPEVLRGFVRYCHAERDIPARLTEETLDAIDRWEAEYQRIIRTPRPQGPAALLAAMGVPWDALDDEIYDDGAWDDGAWDDDDIYDDIEYYDIDYDDIDYDDIEYDDIEYYDLADYQALVIKLLERAVGGPEALQTLDGAPLPDEPFDWTGIPTDVHDRVAEVLALCDRCCDELLDVEHRTAARRVLARIARLGPDALRRRGRADTAAAAICWAVGRANHTFDQRRGGLTQKALLEHFGLQGSIGARAATLLEAGGLPAYPRDHGLGSPDYLVSRRRQHILDQRRRCSG